MERLRGGEVEGRKRKDKWRTRGKKDGSGYEVEVWRKGWKREREIEEGIE